MRIKDIDGQRFSQWLVVGRAPNRGLNAAWNCVCACGTERVVLGCSLRGGQSKSCGCVPRVTVGHRHTIDRRMTPTYRSYRSMIDRCTYPSHAGFAHYAARGITVCERWRDFNNFLADMGERPDGMTIERIRNAEGYKPGNCR